MQTSTRLDPKSLLGFKLQAQTLVRSDQCVAIGAKIGKPKPPSVGVAIGAKIGKGGPPPGPAGIGTIMGAKVGKGTIPFE